MRGALCYLLALSGCATALESLRTTAPIAAQDTRAACGEAAAEISAGVRAHRFGADESRQRIADLHARCDELLTAAELLEGAAADLTRVIR